MLAKQHATELGEPLGRLVEHAEHGLAVANRERHHSPLAVAGVLEQPRRCQVARPRPLRVAPPRAAEQFPLHLLKCRAFDTQCVAAANDTGAVAA
jgi:hypothetical protein